jgi:tRNA (guanine37-N1)-methyltransferase
MLEVAVVSILPQMFDALNHGVCGRAIQQKLVEISLMNPRDFTYTDYRQVDDRPYGGGPGMVMMVEPIIKAIKGAKAKLGRKAKVVYLSPQGKTIDQQLLNDVAKKEQPLVLITGRYEGIDERVLSLEVDEEWSIGDYVVSGGELAAMLVIDAISRLLPGSLGHSDSAIEDSFMNGMLDHPHYTRPETIAGLSVPSILLSGDHLAIQKWRKKQSLGRTWQRRPDLLAKKELTESEKELLNEFISELRS